MILGDIRFDCSGIRSLGDVPVGYDPSIREIGEGRTAALDECDATVALIERRSEPTQELEASDGGLRVLLAPRWGTGQPMMACGAAISAGRWRITGGEEVSGWVGLSRVSSACSSLL